MTDEPTPCDYCGSIALAYDLQSGRGAETRCIPCLAIEQGQQQFTMPFEEFVNNDKHEDSPVFEDAADWLEHREMSYEAARDWYRVLARIQSDEPVLKRDADAISAINEHTRTFLENVMGAEAFHPPSKAVGSEVGVGQATFADVERDDEPR